MEKLITHGEQLKSPKWQKNRLEIMERDSFKCRICESGEVQLHVHHIDYSPELKLWEYESNRLITICETCHKKIHEYDIISVKDNGILSVYDFIQIFPSCLVFLDSLENHKGDWTFCLNMRAGYFPEKVMMLCALHNYIKDCDNKISLTWWDNLNFCDLVKPVGSFDNY